MSAQTFTLDEAHAAMCLWEEIVDPQMKDAGEPWLSMREQIGLVELRFSVLALGPACDAAWTKAQSHFETMHRIWDHRRQDHEVQGKPFFDEEPQEPGCFDYEFVPFWMRNCVDWTGSVPRVKGSGT